MPVASIAAGIIGAYVVTYTGALNREPSSHRPRFANVHGEAAQLPFARSFDHNKRRCARENRTGQAYEEGVDVKFIFQLKGTVVFRPLLKRLVKSYGLGHPHPIKKTPKTRADGGISSQAKRFPKVDSNKRGLRLFTKTIRLRHAWPGLRRGTVERLMTLNFECVRKAANGGIFDRAAALFATAKASSRSGLGRLMT